MKFEEIIISYNPFYNHIYIYIFTFIIIIEAYFIYNIILFSDV